MKKRIFSHFSLGCKVNQAEMDSLHRLLLQNDWQKASPREKAELCIINTCTVTGMADRKSRQKIRRVINDNPGAFIIVTGCYAESSKKEVEQIEGVSLVLGNEEKLLLPEILKEKSIIVNPVINHRHSDFIPEGRTRVFLKIQEGCENFCSYCIIPYMRGKIKSVPSGEVIERVKNLSLSGYKEIVLTGINLGTYGRDTGNINLTELLGLICSTTGIKRLRLSSVEPDIDEKFLDLFLEYKNLCPHLHIPLQHGHNKILHDMNRHYTAEQYREIINMARNKIPDLSVTTDVMTGFPGEEDEHFYATKNLIEELQFARLHVFCYSPREGTAAAGFPGQVDEKIKQERSKILIKTGEAMAERFYKKFIGRTMHVLFEHKPDKKTGLLKGLTGNYLSVLAPGEKKFSGQIMNVKIKGMEDKFLSGEILAGEE